MNNSESAGLELSRISLPEIWRNAPSPSRLAGFLGAGLIILICLLAIFPSTFAPYDPAELVGTPLQKPGQDFIIGTNDIGQDLLSELIWGTRASLLVGISVGTLALLIGTSIGLISATRQGPIDAILMRLVDLMLVIPFLPLIILLSAYLGPNLRNIILLLTLVFWAPPARLIRSRALNLLAEPYIEAAWAIGCTRRRVIVAHLWPGVRTLAAAQFILVTSGSILAEASLSFLGLGDPSVKSWGTMLYFARASGAFLGDAWMWWVLPTGLMITLSVLSLALVNYAFEGRFEPGR